jgi:hypothetical protein
MKLISFLLFLLTSFTLLSQPLVPGMKWFDNEAFFDDSLLLQEKIKSISISVSDKKDGSYFTPETPFLFYLFTADGQLLKSDKYISLKHRTDTSTLLFRYTPSGNLLVKTEKQGPYVFEYHYHYKKDKLQKEVKLAPLHIPKDTANLKYYKNSEQDTLLKRTVLNSSHKAYMEETKVHNQQGLLLLERTDYLRNSSFTEARYQYNQQGQLIQKKETSFFGSEENRELTFTYVGNLLEKVAFYENGKLRKKLAFTFNEQQLIEAVIERDLSKKEVRIYRLSYTFFNQN